MIDFVTLKYKQFKNSKIYYILHTNNNTIKKKF